MTLIKWKIIKNTKLEILWDFWFPWKDVDMCKYGQILPCMPGIWSLPWSYGSNLWIIHDSSFANTYGRKFIFEVYFSGHLCRIKGLFAQVFYSIFLIFFNCFQNSFKIPVLSIHKKGSDICNFFTFSAWNHTTVPQNEFAKFYNEIIQH